MSDRKFHCRLPDWEEKAAMVVSANTPWQAAEVFARSLDGHSPSQVPPTKRSVLVHVSGGWRRYVVWTRINYQAVEGVGP